ncbi:MAG: cysteine--tRNA ligase, partial [Muribaculaceae bacterium]|nr:cysteine--tRNA ligase [Muribaculaceae bacterium]
GHDTVRYWMHNNMITINGKKMGKSLGNFITLDEFFSGSHPLLQQPYSPMTIRFFILQAHYRGTVDFSNEALQAAEKALERMLDGYRRLQQLKPAEESTVDVSTLEKRCYDAIDDDFNTPVLIAELFDACRIINQINDGTAKANQADIDTLKHVMDTFLVEILGITVETQGGGINLKPYEDAVDLLLDIRSDAKKNKDWATSDRIRDRLKEIGFDVKDTKDGFEWKLQ